MDKTQVLDYINTYEAPNGLTMIRGRLFDWFKMKINVEPNYFYRAIWFTTNYDAKYFHTTKVLEIANTKFHVGNVAIAEVMIMRWVKANNMDIPDLFKHKT